MRPPVVIAHDYLTQRGGAERVVLALAHAFPGAPIYTLLYDPDQTYPEFRGLDVRVSPLNHLAFFRRRHRAALPFLAIAAQRMLVEADLLLASSSGWAHGIRVTGRKAVYCYTPARWLYQTEAYLGPSPSRLTGYALAALKPALIRWDRAAASKADLYFAISTAVRERIYDVYGIDAQVLPAPVTLEETSFAVQTSVPGAPQEFFLCVARLLPYKNVDLVVRAFANLNHNLVVIGAGPEKARLMGMATPNVHFYSGLTDSQMDFMFSRCDAVVAASIEDFGLTPLEAAARGRPSVVFRHGGFLDTVTEHVNGVFFDSLSPEAVRSAVERASSYPWNSDKIRKVTARFSEQRFVEDLRRSLRGMGLVAHE